MSQVSGEDVTATEGEAAPVDTVFVRSVLDRLTYKPGWHFSLDIRTGPRVYLYAWVDADADSRTGEPRVGMAATSKRWPIDWPPQARPATVEQVVAWVRHAIHEWEAHEADEWLRLDGEIVHDPHACVQCLVGGCRA